MNSPGGRAPQHSLDSLLIPFIAPHFQGRALYSSDGAGFNLWMGHCALKVIKGFRISFFLVIGVSNSRGVVKVLILPNSPFPPISPLLSYCQYLDKREK